MTNEMVLVLLGQLAKYLQLLLSSLQKVGIHARVSLLAFKKYLDSTYLIP